MFPMKVEEWIIISPLLVTTVPLFQLNVDFKICTDDPACTKIKPFSSLLLLNTSISIILTPSKFLSIIIMLSIAVVTFNPSMVTSPINQQVGTCTITNMFVSFRKINTQSFPSGSSEYLLLLIFSICLPQFPELQFPTTSIQHLSQGFCFAHEICIGLFMTISCDHWSTSGSTSF